MQGYTRGLRCLLAALAAAGAVTASAQEVLPGANLASLLDYARAHNPEYAAMRFEADAAGERATPAGALPDPKFRAELRDITRFGAQEPTLFPNRTGSTRYLLMQDVPWSGKRDLRREIAALGAESAREQARETWEELAAHIKSAYARLYLAHRSERLMREMLDLMVRIEKVALARYSGGLAAQQDVIRAQVEQSHLRNRLAALEGERRQIQARINTLLARPAGAPLAEPERLRPIPAPGLLDAATLGDRLRARNPRLFTEAARVRSAEKGRELTRKNRYPDFTFGVSPIQYRNAVREWELMVELNIPLQQDSRRAQERESEAMLAAARARSDAASNQALGELLEHLSGLDASRRSETLISGSLLPQSELTFQAALAGYENGKVDFATLIDAQRQILQSRQGLAEAQVEAQGRLAEIERLLGEEP